MKKSPRENGLEFKVGLFVCFGLLIIGAMVLEFGLGGSQLFRKYTELNVDLPNASGLLKGSEVLVAGARVGYVSGKPVLSGNLAAVRVQVKIDDRVKIPKGSIFKVDSSGLLGDKFISVHMADDFDASKFNANDPAQVYHSGDVIEGGHTPDITEIAANAAKQLTSALTDFQEIVKKLDTGILSQGNIQNLQDTLASFPPLAKSAQSTVDKADETMAKASETMATLHDAAENLRVTLGTARDFIDKASHGDGLIGQLVNNRPLADNFYALVKNLREHGVLFYKNSSPTNPPAPTPRDKREH